MPSEFIKTLGVSTNEVYEVLKPMSLIIGIMYTD